MITHLKHIDLLMHFFKLLSNMQKKRHFLQISLVCIFFCFSLSAFAQKETISGKIIDEKSQPLPGVTVKVKDSNTSAISNTNGVYVIKAVKGQILVFTYLGKVTQQIKIEDNANVDVALKEQEASGLNEVIVTGYMTQRKADLTGSVSVVTQKDLNKNHGSTNILESLQGVVPGLHITTDGSPVCNIGIQIRGVTSITGSYPLIVIDGVPTKLNLRDINANNIESFQS